MGALKAAIFLVICLALAACVWLLWQSPPVPPRPAPRTDPVAPAVAKSPPVELPSKPVEPTVPQAPENPEAVQQLAQRFTGRPASSLLCRVTEADREAILRQYQQDRPLADKRGLAWALG